MSKDYLHCMWLGDGDGAGGIRTDDNDCNPPVFAAIIASMIIIISDSSYIPALDEEFLLLP